MILENDYVIIPTFTIADIAYNPSLGLNWFSAWQIHPLYWFTANEGTV
jgi:hypothetical protein